MTKLHPLALALALALGLVGCASGGVARRLGATDPVRGDAGLRYVDGASFVPTPFGDDAATGHAPPPAPTTLADAGPAAGDAGVALPSLPSIRCGRTYDQERSYFATTGNAHYVMLVHHDNTSLPASEGGASCTTRCNEQVTRLEAGATLEGVFEDLLTFSAQGAFTRDPATGTLVIEACGREIARIDMHVASSSESLPGFNNLPQPAWAVPSLARCSFVLRAAGGYVDVRAVTTTCGAPTPNGP